MLPVSSESEALERVEMNGLRNTSLTKLTWKVLCAGPSHEINIK